MLVVIFREDHNILNRVILAPFLLVTSSAVRPWCWCEQIKRAICDLSANPDVKLRKSKNDVGALMLVSLHSILVIFINAVNINATFWFIFGKKVGAERATIMNASAESREKPCKPRPMEDIRFCSMDAPKARACRGRGWPWLRRDSQIISEWYQLKTDDPLPFLHCKGEATEAQHVPQGQGPHKSYPGVKSQSEHHKLPRLVLSGWCAG